MHHNIKLVAVVTVLLVIVVSLGILVSKGGGIAGAGVAKNIACFEDKDCNDHITATEDTCKNPGTAHSLCVNKIQQ